MKLCVEQVFHGDDDVGDEENPLSTQSCQIHPFSDIVAMMDADFEERRPEMRGPYKKRVVAA